MNAVAGFLGAFSAETSALILAWAAIVILTFALAGLLRQVRLLRTAALGRASTAAVGPELGSLAPELASTDSITAALFLEENCPMCDLVRLRLPRLLAATKQDVRPLFIYPNTLSTVAQPDESVLRDRPELFEKFGVRATPHAVIIDTKSRVLLSQPIGSLEALEEFVAQGLFDRILDSARARGETTG